MVSNFNKNTFIALHKTLGKKDIKAYQYAKENSNNSFNSLREEQNYQLQKLIKFAYENVTYYKNLFKNRNITPGDIRTIEDLNILPILTKNEIVQNYNDFYPSVKIAKYFQGSTGGSTGQPLKYRISEYDQALSFGLLYRGWNYGDYELGDSLLMLGGGSIVKTNISFKKKIYHRLKNHFIASSYGMDKNYFIYLISLIYRNKIKFIRGYASSIYLLADFIKNNVEYNDKIKSLKAIFTTAEMLYPQQRKIIEEIFQVKVFNGYGLNDGGISAYEDGKQKGFLIDTERAIMECVNENGINTLENSGRIIATSLHNFDFPFIRYDTGDMGIISNEFIKKGGNRMLLKNLLGRANDFLEINGRKIGSPVLSTLMGNTNASRYQFIQLAPDTLEIRIEKGDLYNKDDEEFIQKSIIEHVKKCNIHFIYGNQFAKSENKHKFIIRDF